MSDALTPLRRRFLERVGRPRWWTSVVFSAPRNAVAACLAALPSAALLLLVAAGPPSLGQSVTEANSVDEVFSRMAGAVATASTIAVAVASLALGRELTGVGSLREHYDANLAYHERVRRGAGTGEAPLALGPFLRVALEAVCHAVEGVREAAAPQDMEARLGRVTLGECLDAVDAAATRAADGLEGASASPDRVLLALLDFDSVAADHRVRQFLRTEGLTGGADEALEALGERLQDVIVGTDYAKTMELEWGVSRMSTAILVTAVPAIATAVLMILTYSYGAVEAWGVNGATLLIAGALAVTLAPIAVFASYLLRFVFVNQYTLPTAGFVLGPEEPEEAWRAADPAAPRGPDDDQA